MIWTKNTVHALEVAMCNHSGQKDKIGAPYLIHAYEVGRNQDTEDAVIVGFLHDVLEDSCKNENYDGSKYFITEILGFSDEIFEALWVLNHRNSTPYMEYIEKVAENDLARKVKIQDIKHNLSPDRLAMLPKDTAERLEKKYRPALEYLLLAERAAKEKGEAQE